MHGGNNLVTLSESLTLMSEIPARQAFGVSATDTDIYLLCPDAVECYGYDGVQNWVQTDLPSRPLAVVNAASRRWCLRAVGRRCWRAARVWAARAGEGLL